MFPKSDRPIRAESDRLSSIKKAIAFLLRSTSNTSRGSWYLPLVL